jgi:cytochrome c oxidase subunit II
MMLQPLVNNLAGKKLDIDSFWLPRSNSTFAHEVDWAWNIVMWISVGFFALIVGAGVYFVYKYRRKGENDITSDIDHNFKLEVAWSVIPLILCAGLFFVGLKGYVNAAVAPAEAYEIHVTAKQWSWTFQYPNGYTTGKLTLPAGRPVKMIMSAQDVLHSFYIPEFRVKRDVIPGLYTTLWFEAVDPATTVLQCAEYCGKDHSNMASEIEVMEGPAFDKWIAEVEAIELEKTDPVALGQKLYTERGCNSCHTLDGSKNQGPTFKGIWGRQEQLADGSTVTVDENYVRESILDPHAKIVAGYAAVMPSFEGQLKPKHIDGIIAFLKTVK